MFKGYTFSLFEENPKILKISADVKSHPDANICRKKYLCFAFFVFWYEKIIGNEPYELERTHVTGVRFSSYQLVAFSCSFMIRRFIVDFAVKSATYLSTF
jgi:hypothetical protein